MMGRRLRWPWPPTLVRVLIIAAWLVVWEAVVRFGLVGQLLVAPPSSTVVAMVELAGLPEIQAGFVETLLEFVVGFGVAAVVGTLLGFVLGLSPAAFRILNSPLMTLYGTPKSIFLPLFVVFLGLGYQSPAAFAALSAVFPVIITVIAGIRALDQRLLMTADSLGASRLDKVRFVFLPGTFPAIISGLWLGIKQALLAVLLAEMFISGTRNVGYWIAHYASAFQAASVYALIAWLSLLAIALGLAWRRLEAHASRWRLTERGATL